MAFTANKNLETPANGAYVGTWDVPVNSNTTIIDASFGGVATVALTNSPVTLSAAQYQNTFITFTGALSGNCTITFPAVGSFYTIQNLTSNTSAFIVTLQTSAAGNEVISCMPREPFDIMTDGLNVRFRNLGPIGTYMDYAGSSAPSWVTNCSIPPYQNCDGTTFSSATYPILATILGGTTLPDLRGRTRFYNEQGTGRLGGASSGAGIGAATATIAQANLPNYALTVTDPGHTHNISVLDTVDGLPAAAIRSAVAGLTATLTGAALINTTGVTVNSGGSGTAFSILSPGLVSGLTLIRSG